MSEQFPVAESVTERQKEYITKNQPLIVDDSYYSDCLFNGIFRIIRF